MNIISTWCFPECARNFDFLIKYSVIKGMTDLFCAMEHSQCLQNAQTSKPILCCSLKSADLHLHLGFLGYTCIYPSWSNAYVWYFSFIIPLTCLCIWRCRTNLRLNFCLFVLTAAEHYRWCCVEKILCWAMTVWRSQHWMIAYPAVASNSLSEMYFNWLNCLGWFCPCALITLFFWNLITVCYCSCLLFAPTPFFMHKW